MTRRDPSILRIGGQDISDTRGRTKADTPLGCCPPCPPDPLRKDGHRRTLSGLSALSATANLHGFLRGQVHLPNRKHGRPTNKRKPTT